MSISYRWEGSINNRGTYIESNVGVKHGVERGSNLRSVINNPLNLLAPPEELVFRPSETALLVIDAQYLVAHPGYGIGVEATRRGLESEFAYYWTKLNEIVPRIRHLQDVCRDLRIAVIHVRIGSITQDCREVSVGHKIRGLFARPGSREICILDEVAPVGDELVITKTSSSPFNSTAIDQILHNIGIKNLVLCGVVTNGCVETTVRDAADRNYRVILVHDACAAMSEELHRGALQGMNGFMGLVRLMSEDEVSRFLASAAADSRRGSVSRAKARESGRKGASK